MSYESLELDLGDIRSSHVFANIIPLTGFDKALTYKVAAEVKLGTLVEVPLGRRRVLGIVIALNVSPDCAASRVKGIHKSIYPSSILTQDLIDLGQWMSRYYACTLGSVFESLIPAAIKRGQGHKKVRHVELIGEPLEDVLKTLKSRAPKQYDLYLFLAKQTKAMPWPHVQEALSTSDAALKGLIAKGIAKETYEITHREAYDDAFSKAELVVGEAPALTEEQSLAVDSIKQSVDTGQFGVHLLHGVTGSGKTEVFLRLIEKVVHSGGSVLYLVPEVVLTPQTVGRIRGRLQAVGVKTVVWHSGLSDGERVDAWMSMISNRAQVVVGARSAVFTPLQNIKLVIVDEEHEAAYKQEDTPRYHGRDVAVYRAKLCSATCVLGSATPSLESLFNVKYKGYKINKLTKRVDDRLMPKIHIVDMRRETEKKGGRQMISQQLKDMLIDRFEKKEQAILFINRRGYSTSMLCPSCGYVASCPHCSISLTLHRTDQYLRCHLCDYRQKAPKACASCQSTETQWRGYGTQRLEDVVQKIIPNAKVVRVDADAFSKKDKFREILADFRRGRIDILVGTQMLAKGLDFPNVTLVGMVDADLSMHVQDFRAGERTFQLLVQVAGRAGRGDKSGEVLIQTFTPHCDPIQFARRGDFDGFLEAELELRREFQYPPHRHIMRHLFRSKNPDKAIFYAEQWTKTLEQYIKRNNLAIEIRGPAPAPIEKIKDYHRFQVWYFVTNVSKMVPHITTLKKTFKFDKDVIEALDVDPVDLI